MARAGRKRSATAHREKNGKAQRKTQEEREKDIMAVALAQPHRQGERSHLAGFALGRLLLGKRITQEQFNAGETYGVLAVRYMHNVLGAHYRFPSPFFGDRIGGGNYSMTPLIEPNVETIVRNIAEVTAELRYHGLRGASPALMNVCLLDLDPSDEEAEMVRRALEVLAKMWGVSK